MRVVDNIANDETLALIFATDKNICEALVFIPPVLLAVTKIGYKNRPTIIAEMMILPKRNINKINMGKLRIHRSSDTFAYEAVVPKKTGSKITGKNTYARVSVALEQATYRGLVNILPAIFALIVSMIYENSKDKQYPIAINFVSALHPIPIAVLSYASTMKKHRVNMLEMEMAKKIVLSWKVYCSLPKDDFALHVSTQAKISQKKITSAMISNTTVVT